MILLLNVSQIMVYCLLGRNAVWKQNIEIPIVIGYLNRFAPENRATDFRKGDRWKLSVNW